MSSLTANKIKTNMFLVSIKLLIVCIILCVTVQTCNTYTTTITTITTPLQLFCKQHLLVRSVKRRSSNHDSTLYTQRVFTQD